MARFFHGMGTIMIASIDTLNRWAEKHRRETSAPPAPIPDPIPISTARPAPRWIQLRNWWSLPQMMERSYER